MRTRCGVHEGHLTEAPRTRNVFGPQEIPKPSEVKTNTAGMETSNCHRFFGNTSEKW